MAKKKAPKVTRLENVTPTREERATARASDTATRSNKKASRLLKDWEDAGGSTGSGTSMADILRTDQDERERAAIQKFMSEPTEAEERAASSADTVGERVARHRRATKFEGLKPGDPHLTAQGLEKDPEAEHSVDAARLGGAVPEAPKEGRQRAEREGAAGSPRGQQRHILATGTADEYWKHVAKHSAFFGLNATRDGKPVSGFCTNCDNPIFRSDVEPLIEDKSGKSINTTRPGALTTPIDDSLCDTCQPHAGVVTPAGQAALAEKFNVQRGERG